MHVSPWKLPCESVFDLLGVQEVGGSNPLGPIQGKIWHCGDFGTRLLPFDSVPVARIAEGRSFGETFDWTLVSRRSRLVRHDREEAIQGRRPGRDAAEGDRRVAQVHVEAQGVGIHRRGSTWGDFREGSR
jgi:hypothetical protein